MIVVPGSIPKMMRSFANFNLLFCVMLAISHKAKQFLVVAAKLLIVGGAFYFIYRQLAHNDQLQWVLFAEKYRKNQSLLGIIFLVAFSVANRFLEILKWQNLVATIRKISLAEATKQVLGALTAGIFTPNGIGEYAGKALFFEKALAKKVVFLNLVCNGIQMLLSVVFGILGLVYFNTKFPIVSAKTVLLVFAGFMGVLLVLSFVKKLTVKGYSLEKLADKVKDIPKKIHRNNILLGTLRYLVFSHQYYFLFLAFDVHLPYLVLMSGIASVYFLASSLPTFQFLDFAVKGSVAVYFFGILGVNQWIVVFISTLMWLLNVVFPVLIGSYYVLRFKPLQNA